MFDTVEKILVNMIPIWNFLASGACFFIRSGALKN
jgi:hypothetical protein